MTERNTGYSLLGVGLLIMFIAVGIIILTLTNNMKPISVFNIPAPTLNTASFMPHIPGFPKPTGTDIVLLPTAAFNKLLNIGVEFMLMYFIMSFGFKLADLGVKLIRPIKISAK